MRLVDQRRVVWQNRGQFFGVAAQMMRRILVDRARARKMAKRSGQWARVTVDDAARATPPVNVDVLDLDAALARLAEFDPRRCQPGGTPVFWRVVTCRGRATRWGFHSRRPSAIGRRRERGCPRNCGRGTAVTPERWRQITEIFHAALARDARERTAFLADACAGDEGMRSEIESMLAQPGSSDGFLGGLAVAARRRLTGWARPTSPIALSVPITSRRALARAAWVRCTARGTPKLGRAVAIKFLPHVFTNDPERLARFEREARLLAALNHPHIGAIYGFEEADGVRGLVLELVQGETLAARLQRGLDTSH